MRFGIVILPDQPWNVARTRWQRAEQYGFDNAWTYDHLGWRELVDGPWFDAVSTLTAAAAVTGRIRLGTLVASANFRHPVHFAREVITLDDISDGRVVLGLGSGGLGFDSAVLGNPALSMRQRIDRFAEFLALLDGVLRTDHVDFDGEYYRAVDARNLPGCRQRPRVPFVVAANGPRAIGLAARYGQGWVTTGAQADTMDQWWASVAEGSKRLDDALVELGRDPADFERHLTTGSAPVYSLSSAECFVEHAGRAEEIGITDLIVPWPRESGWYAGSETVLEQVAATVVGDRQRPAEVGDRQRPAEVGERPSGGGSVEPGH